MRSDKSLRVQCRARVADAQHHHILISPVRPRASTDVECSTHEVAANIANTSARNGIGTENGAPPKQHCKDKNCRCSNVCTAQHMPIFDTTPEIICSSPTERSDDSEDNDIVNRLAEQKAILRCAYRTIPRHIELLQALKVSPPSFAARQSHPFEDLTPLSAPLPQALDLSVRIQNPVNALRRHRHTNASPYTRSDAPNQQLLSHRADDAPPFTRTEITATTHVHHTLLHNPPSEDSSRGSSAAEPRRGYKSAQPFAPSEQRGTASGSIPPNRPEQHTNLTTTDSSLANWNGQCSKPQHDEPNQGHIRPKKKVRYMSSSLANWNGQDMES